MAPCFDSCACQAQQPDAASGRRTSTRCAAAAVFMCRGQAAVMHAWLRKMASWLAGRCCRNASPKVMQCRSVASSLCMVQTAQTALSSSTSQPPSPSKAAHVALLQTCGQGEVLCQTIHTLTTAGSPEQPPWRRPLDQCHTVDLQLPHRRASRHQAVRAVPGTPAR